MERNVFKVADVRKAFFLISFFIFLLFGFQVFAAACDKPPAWNKAGTCTVDIYYEDPTGGSDLAECKYTTVSGTSPSCPTNGTWQDAPNCDPTCSGSTSCICNDIPISIGPTGDCYTNGEGACKICSKAADTAGNTGYGELSLNVDYTSPGTAIECNGTICSAGWYNADISITLFCSDSDSGCDKTYYCIDQTNSCSPGTLYIGAFNLTAEGTNYVRYYSTDIAGNIEPTNSKTIKLDKTGPISQFTDVATPPAGSTVTTDFDVSADDWDRPLGTAGVDNSGLASCYYGVYDSGVGWTKSGETRNCSSDLSFTVTVSPTGDCRTIRGTCTVSVYAYDAAGNPGDGQSRTFNIEAENNPPQLDSISVSPDYVKQGDQITVNSLASDPDGDNIRLECGSSTGSNNLCIGDYASINPSCTFSSPWTDDTTHTIYCRVYDSNLYSEERTGTIISDNTFPLTTVSPDEKDWGNADVDFTVSCDDGTGSGCQTTQYKIIEQSQTCDTSDLITGTSGTVTCPANQTCQKKVCFRSIDNVGNEEPINTSNLFKIDKEKPTSEITSPPADSEQTGDFNVSVTDSDGSGSGLDVCYYHIYDSGAGWTQYDKLRTCNSSFTVTVGEGKDCRTEGGTCTVYVYALDVAGNLGDTNSRTFNIRIDITPPTSVLTEYLPDPTNDNTPTYSGTSTDTQSNVVDIEWRVDGGSWLDVDPFASALSVSFTFTALVLADGTHIIEARAQDEVGNWETIYPSDSLTIDTESPIVGPISPTSALINEPETFSANVSDNIEVTNCWLYVAGVNDGEMSLSASPCPSCTASKSHTFASTGDYSLYTLCLDGVGNYGSGPPVTVTVTAPDTTPPYRVSWAPLSRGCTNANTDIIVTVEYADDESGMAETRYCWATGASCVPTALFINPNGGTVTQSSTGNWTLCVKATDNASPSNSVTECEGTYIVDKLPPNLPTFDPSSRDWSNEDISVTVTYTDNLCGITYTRHCWTEGASCEPGTIASSTFVNGTSITKSDNGSWTLCARARDGAGNWRNTDCSGPYQIDKIGPLVGEISPTSALINEPETFSANVSDNIEVTNCWLYVAGVNDGEMSLSASPCPSCTASKSHTFASTGDYSLYTLCLDGVGNYGSGPPVTVTVTAPDTTPPYRVSWDPLSRDCTNANTDISVTVEYADLDSGMAETRYCWTTGVSCVPTTLFADLNGGTATQSSTGNWTLCVETTDNAFPPNSITECEGTYIVDKLPPNLPTFDPTSRDWSYEDVSVIVTYADNLCGITYTRHCWTEGASCEPGTTEASTFTNGSSVIKTETGIWTLCARARDGAGNWRETDCSGPYKIDKTLPSGTLEVTPSSPEVGQDITITISANDGESGVDYLLAEDDGIYLPSKGCGGAASCDKSWIVQETVTGDHTYCGLIYDLADNVNGTIPYCLTITVKEADTTPPYRVSWDPLSRGCTNANTDIIVTVEYADDESGMAETRYCWATGASCVPTALFINPNGGTVTQSSTGNWTLCVKATDNASPSNSITECEGTYIVDKLPPNLPTFDPSSRDWSNEDISVIVTYTDNLCGITYTRHCWTEGASCEPGTTEASTFTNGTSITKSDNGVWTLCARARDGAGNWRNTDCSGSYQIDKIGPLVGEISPTSALINEPETFSANVSDNIEVTNCWLYIFGGEYGEWPGTNDGEMSLSASPCSSCTANKDHTFASTGDYDLYTYCIDEAGNPGVGTPVTVEVTEFGPLICNVNVPDTGVINQWVEINVSGSQGAITGVRFSSDNNQNGVREGAWDPSPPNYYGWNISSGNWDATSKTMKWSFVATGNYEAWAELKNGGLTTCYDTITIFECYPGQEDTCISGQGCSYIITCKPDGTWPTCPIDECIKNTSDSIECPCSGIDVCVGADYYDYPDYGDCDSSCVCNISTASGQPCAPTIYPYDSRCTYCGDGHCDSSETIWNCCQDCGVPASGCEFNLKYWYECEDIYNPTKYTEDCGSDSWTENYQCSGNYVQREYCERGCQEASCYENCYWLDWQDCDSWDGCVDADYYDYSCSGAACIAEISYGDPRCESIFCGDGHCDSSETIWNCCQDCGVPASGCEFNLKYWYECEDIYNPTKYTEDCGSDSWTENYQCSGNYVQREYCERGCQEASCYENCYWLDWQDCDSFDGCVDADYYNYSCSGTSCIAEISYGDPRCTHDGPGHDQCDSDADCNDGNSCTDNWCERPEDPDSICRRDNFPEGTDCGVCKVCDDSGNCINQPDGENDCEEEGCQRCVSGSCQDYYLACSDGTDETSCECISDVCIDCSDYYDGSCGYQGICFCGDYETPVWSCLDGECQCECIYNEAECGSPPPECTRKNPEVYIAPTSQEGAAGKTLTYTVWVTNQDQGTECGSSTFSLAAGEYCNESGWACSLNLTSLTINSGQSDSTTLWVTSPSNTPKGDKDISVTARNTDFPEFFGTGYTTYEVLNNPPSATNLSADATGQCFPPETHPFATAYLSWDFDDPDLAATQPDYQSAYQVQIDNDSDFSSIENDSGKIFSGSKTYSPSAGLDFDFTYYWKVKVWDAEDAESDWSEKSSFHTDPMWPWPDFNWSPETPSAGGAVQFCSVWEEDVCPEDKSWCYNLETSCLGTAFSWTIPGTPGEDYEYIDGTTSSSENPRVKFLTTIKEGEVILTIEDVNYHECSASHNLTITKPLPEWKEIAPY